MEILIVGAGIGGLAAAGALAADGHAVSVFEQAPGLRRGGAAVTLWSNGTGILESLGVSLVGVGTRIDVLETRDARGRVLVSVDVARSATHYGHPHLCVPRARLLERLAGRLPANLIAFGRTGTGADQDGLAVRASFADGGTATGDLLVSADGRGSAIRDQLWGGDPAEFTGWATWQGLTQVPIDLTSDHRSVLFVGRGGSCGLMPAGEGLLQWWFDQRWTPGSPPAASTVAALRASFGDWASPVTDVLAAITDDDLGFFPHVRHKVPRTWGAGRITVIGDAAHSMPPTRAQGANQALEDAWALAAALRTRADGPTALRAFERARSPRAALVARQAGSEDYNKRGGQLSMVSRLIPDALASRYYTRWLGQVSNYLTA